MYKLIACWSAPGTADEEAFEAHYREVHVPLARRVPGLRRIVLTRTGAGLEGAEPAFFRVAEMVFESADALERSSQSQEWKALREDAGRMIERFDVTLNVGIGYEEQPAVGG
jgi:uncharacterized protein (TIGR02118 family)